MQNCRTLQRAVRVIRGFRGSSFGREGGGRDGGLCSKLWHVRWGGRSSCSSRSAPPAAARRSHHAAAGAEASRSRNRTAWVPLVMLLTFFVAQWPPPPRRQHGSLQLKKQDGMMRRRRERTRLASRKSQRAPMAPTMSEAGARLATPAVEGGLRSVGWRRRNDPLLFFEFPRNWHNRQITRSCGGSSAPSWLSRVVTMQ